MPEVDSKAWAEGAAWLIHSSEVVSKLHFKGESLLHIKSLARPKYT